MKHEKTIQTIENIPDVGRCEKEDIINAMQENAEFSRSWINDSILRRYIKKTGDERLNADTRKLIKAKSYDDYIELSKSIQRNLKKQAQALLEEIRNK